ncbi:prolyl oligopeptidase family serine peptidase [Paenibacillus aurantius]|uniref:Prolyl oligopeptidase family serine peptidase n=1 Tax=Paenibacillus aurantius TaxID=2918900 RepID=A0AA96RGH3_9BACL|nr:prolyl oligopeptidase family serine peptidase [Paenibacillus aurantius]WNQ12536.1 prolyl oligopeptidase family serine peptidase [Paenibacillus aurantius]
MAYVLSELNRSGLPPLLQGIEKEEQWSEKLSHIRAVWLDYIGGLPARPAVDLRVHSSSKRAGYTQLHISYSAALGDRITAYLLLPDKLEATRPAGTTMADGYPAVLALHPTIDQGKDDIALPTGRENRRYALELVQRGYVVLAPDALTAGERISPGYPAFHTGPFYEQYPEWTIVAKNISDHMQGLDVLCSLDYVNPKAIGAIGHSFGGYNSYFLAGMDRRVRAVVSSCGFSPFTNDPEPDHWTYRAYPYTHIPKIAADLHVDRVPFEFHEIVALCAPVPSFHYAGQEDHIFPHWKAVGEGMLELSKLYRWLGREERFRSILGSGSHDFPEEIRLLAYRFLDHWLKGNRDA